MKADPIGFVGLGAMGTPMVTRLSRQGLSVKVHDADSPRATALGSLSGVTPVMSLADMAGARIVVCMLPTSDVVDDVVGGSSGLTTVLASGALIVDMSSSDPWRTVELARRASAAGLELVDAPVSGGVRQAGNGGLTIMFGGRDDQLERCRFFFDALAARIVQVGDVGAAHAMKALNNVMSAVGLTVACEVIEIGRRFGLDPNVMLEVLNGSTGRNHATETKIAQYVLSGTYDSGFSLALMLKDLNIAHRLADGVGATSPLGDAARELWANAARELPSDADQTRIAGVFDKDFKP